MADPRQSDVSIRAVPILRGLLARPTGNDDRPFQPPILEKTSGKKLPRLVELDPPGPKESDDDWRARCAAILKKSRPEIVSIEGVGAFRVIDPKPADGDDPRLAGRVALVTGAAGAIGHGICDGLLKRGCHVAITDLPGEKLETFVAEFQRRDAHRVLGVPMDVTDAASVAAAFATVAARWGGVDLVVINAGIAATGALTEIDPATFQKLERVNVEGTLLVLAEAGRQLARQRIGGDVVLVSTKNVFAPGAGFGAYSATKAAAHQLARIASLEFAPMDVRVNMVAPDAVFSGGGHKSGLWAEVGPGRMKARGLDEKGLEEYYRNRNLLKAKVTAEHVANAVLFFATRQTPTTGACIPVDGGLPDATPR
jgi:NAD(P)-dependent dehydrogenase (short-subunit alcohol dehydrogenase family)